MQIDDLLVKKLRAHEFEIAIETSYLILELKPAVQEARIGHAIDTAALEMEREMRSQPEDETSRSMVTLLVELETYVRGFSPPR